MVERQLVARGHREGAEHPSGQRGQAAQGQCPRGHSPVSQSAIGPRMLLAGVRMGRAAFPGKRARLPEH